MDKEALKKYIDTAEEAELEKVMKVVEKQVVSEEHEEEATDLDETSEGDEFVNISSVHEDDFTQLIIGGVVGFIAGTIVTKILD